MLREWMISLRSRCPPRLVALGYRYAAIACLTRAERCAPAWAPHQQRSARAILAAMADAPAGRNTALILGSGPCLDIPVPELLVRFPRLLLVDAVHPPAALALARRHPGIELVTAELTGMADALVQADGECPVPPRVRLFLDDPDIGLVVSANLASQLPLVPMRQAHRRWPAQDGAALGRAVVEAHLDHLRCFSCPILLIADVQRRVLDGDGRVTEMEDPLFGAQLPVGPEWDWTLAPMGEVPGGWSIINRVRATRLDLPQYVRP